MVEVFVAKTLELLKLEHEAEKEESCASFGLPVNYLEGKGICLGRLRLQSAKTGLYGRKLLKFTSRHTDKELPPHRFSSGDIVGVFPSKSALNPDTQITSGVIYKTSVFAITVAIDREEFTSMEFEVDSEANHLFRILRLANDITYRRLKSVTERILNSSSSQNQLIDILFNDRGLLPALQLPAIVFENKNLNESQKDAVSLALKQKELAIIHGPPGTGKTTVVVEIILQLIRTGSKVLCCAPSNIAVDNIVERLVDFDSRVIRLGHPARLSRKIHSHSLEYILTHSDSSDVIQDIRRNIDALIKESLKTSLKDVKPNRELKTLRAELRDRENRALSETLQKASVVCSTLTSATNDGSLKHLKEDFFDVAVIDECSQSLEIACWIAILRAKKVILAGDHLQLPPTILSKEAASQGLEVTLMERLLKRSDAKEFVKMLEIQYRMNEVIMKFSSDALYSSRLFAANSVKNHLLCDLENVSRNEETSQPMVLIDTTGCGLHELVLPDEVSKGNVGEAQLTAHYVRIVLDSGVSADDIAVISPYNLQVELIHSLLERDAYKIEVKSVDGFQGREKEVVVISLVRSNVRHEIGFLAEERRLNVALTRARRHLAVICDSSTVKHHKFIGKFIDYAEEHALLRSASEYSEVISDSLDLPKHLQDLMLEDSTKSRTAKKTVTKPPKNSASSNGPVNPNCKREPNNASFANNHQPVLTEKQIRDKFKAIIDRFIADMNTDTLPFPSSLNSFERRIIHEICEGLKLEHTSVGEAETRQLIVKKLQQPEGCVVQVQKRSGWDLDDKLVNTTDVEHISDMPLLGNDIDTSSRFASIDKFAELCNKNDNILEEKHHPTQTMKCKICDTSVPSPNFDLHFSNCQRMLRLSNNNLQAQKHETLRTSNRSVKARTLCDGFKRLDNVDSDDFDALVNAAEKLDGVCNFRKCKTKVKILGQTCSFCGFRFCLNHHQAEVHGCGDAARIEARKTINKHGELFSGSGVRIKKCDPVKKQMLHRKLDKKLTDMADQRKGKVKNKRK